MRHDDCVDWEGFGMLWMLWMLCFQPLQKNFGGSLHIYICSEFPKNLRQEQKHNIQSIHNIPTTNVKHRSILPNRQGLPKSGATRARSVHEPTPP